ncbi:MAG: sulfotransferase [Elainellaceae cyanobacterium]
MSNGAQPNLPKFLVIGAAKSGTTTLATYLRKHPECFIPEEKEPNFFGIDEKYEQGLDYYAALFEPAAENQHCAEASTDYAKWPRYPHVAERIAQHLPDVKLIYLMRHPVERAYSYYVHRHRSGVDETFEEYIARTSEAIDGSNYMMQIERYMPFFSKERFLFLLSEDLVSDPYETLRSVCRFIGVDDTFDFSADGPVAANRGRKVFEDTLRGRVTAPLRRVPLLATVAAAMPQSWRDGFYALLKKTAYGKQVRQTYTAPPMKPETRQELLEYFSKPNENLAKFIGQDLSSWSS